MYTYNKRTFVDNQNGEEKVVTEKATVQCNKCGKSDVYYGKDDMDKQFVDEAFKDFRLMFHYGSRWDTEKWQFNLCENCLEELVNSFRIPCFKTEYAPFTEEGDWYDGISPGSA